MIAQSELDRLYLESEKCFVDQKNKWIDEMAKAIIQGLFKSARIV